MTEDLNISMRAMEERIQRVKQFVSTLENENANLKLQLEMIQDNLGKQEKGEGTMLAKKNIELLDNIRRYKREREFLAEKIKSLIVEIDELKRNVE
jgi:regulator of replication initiation timing